MAVFLRREEGKAGEESWVVRVGRPDGWTDRDTNREPDREAEQFQTGKGRQMSGFYFNNKEGYDYEGKNDVDELHECPR